MGTLQEDPVVTPVDHTIRSIAIRTLYRVSVPHCSRYLSLLLRWPSSEHAASCPRTCKASQTVLVSVSRRHTDLYIPWAFGAGVYLRSPPEYHPMPMHPSYLAATPHVCVTLYVSVSLCVRSYVTMCP